jgi:protein tyrosine/serine phosphatase
MSLTGLSRSIVNIAGLVLCVMLCAACNSIRPIAGSDSWRSRQPSPEDLRVVADYGVKSVVCLRQNGPGEDWYEKEVAVCRELGLELRTLGWSSRNDSQEQIDRLIQALEEMPPPYLIHCKHGIDRTGLAAAVFRVVALGHSKRQSKDELSMWNGHFPFLGAHAMDEAWRRFRWPSEKQLGNPPEVALKQ